MTRAPLIADVQRRASANNSLEILENVTQDVLSAVAQRRELDPDTRGRLQLPMGAVYSTAPLYVTFSRDRPPPSQARLQMLRRQFVRVYASKAEVADLALAKPATDENVEARVARLFTGWLEEALA